MTAQRDCPACEGVGHVQVTPESEGWRREADGRWRVPTSPSGPGGMHRFTGVEMLFRACGCVAGVPEASA